MAACFHRVCGETFTGLTAFDRHLRWLKEPPWVTCRAPLSVGLVWSDNRQQWATHIGPISVATSRGIPTQQDGDISPESVYRKASGAS
jgi:hypothetical protein